MEGFILSWFLLCLFFGSYSCSFSKESLVRAHRKVADLYLTQMKNGSAWPLFVESHYELVYFLEQCFRNDPIQLFRVIRGIVNSRLITFVALAIPYNIRYWDVWDAAYSNNVDDPIIFFKRINWLMDFIIKGKNWPVIKEALPYLFSIQRQYFHHFNLDERKLEQVRKCIEVYEFVLHSFEPNNLNSFIHLFHYLKMLAVEHGGVIPTDKSVQFSILKALKLFEFYCIHFYNYYWEEVEISNLPPKLIYLILVKKSDKHTFKFLNDTKFHDLLNFFRYSDFKSVITAFEAENKTILFYSPEIFRPGSRFYKFMKKCSQMGEKACGLGKKEHWLVRTILLAIPILYAKI
jgi:hypothetical protein